MGGDVDRTGGRGLGARAEGGRVVIEIGRDLETSYNPSARTIELRVEPDKAQAFASVLTEAADAARRRRS